MTHAMNLSATPIEEFVPHRCTMSLLDRLVEADDGQAVAEARVPHDGMFSSGGVMPTWVVIEHMAQAIAAWAGVRARAAGRPVPLGFLLGTRRFEAHRPSLQAGALLTIAVRCELLAANGLGLFDCEVRCGSEPVANAHVSVYEPEDRVTFLKGGTSA
jgi:predicted hotdog family 3-hydroxylacyl-ACP dehydratase